MTYFSIVVMTAVLALVSAPDANAQPRWTDKTILSFDGPIEVPGRTLPAGTYVFQVGNSSVQRHIAQIWNEDQTKRLATTITIPVLRPEPNEDVVVTFASTAPGVPPAIKSWFYPGQLEGHEFVYPEDQARRIAATTKTLLLSGDVDPTRPETIDPERFAMIDENGRRTPHAQYHTDNPPAVAAAPSDSE